MDINQISSLFNNTENASFKLNSENENGKVEFSKILNNAINRVNDDQINADKMDKLLASGEIDNIHDVTIAAQKAELTLSLAIEVKKKVMESYKEIMRLQV